MSELITQIQTLQKNFLQTGGLLNLPEKKQKILDLQKKIREVDFWTDQARAKKISQELADLEKEVGEYKKLEKEVAELLELAPLAIETQDAAVQKELEEKYKKFEKEREELNLKAMLSDKYDENSAILAIHAGTGGVDAQDWAQMLERMYLRYSDHKKFKVNILDRQVGGEAGIKSVILEVLGRYAYGYLKSEAGVHRLVRISPYDAEKMRHTSFALVEVLPELEEVPEIELKDDDLIIDVFRASGHGGQSVNTTDSAVRVRHKPTGIVVTCQNERSQLQNKNTALKILKSRLKQYNETEQEEERKKLRGEFTEAAWGNQIRSYVLQPYHLVKDHRIGYETQEVESVLDGGLDKLIESYLRGKAGN